MFEIQHNNIDDQTWAAERLLEVPLERFSNIGGLDSRCFEGRFQKHYVMVVIPDEGMVGEGFAHITVGGRARSIKVCYHETCPEEEHHIEAELRERFGLRIEELLALK